MYSKIPSSELNLYSEICQSFKIVFDVGCRSDIDYYNIHPDCQYHLFEPNTEALDILKPKIVDKNIILNEFGLSDIEADDQVYYRNVQSFKPHWCVESHDVGDRFSLRKLDDYVGNNNIDHIDFLKIDVEGFDYKVILGGLETIKSKVEYIQLEYSGGIRQYVDLLPEFEFSLMIEPDLLKVINQYNNIGVNFNQPLVNLTDDVINFIDNRISTTGAGGNIFGKRKSIS